MKKEFELMKEIHDLELRLASKRFELESMRRKRDMNKRYTVNPYTFPYDPWNLPRYSLNRGPSCIDDI